MPEALSPWRRPSAWAGGRGENVTFALTVLLIGGIALAITAGSDQIIQLGDRNYVSPGLGAIVFAVAFLRWPHASVLAFALVQLFRDVLSANLGQVISGIDDITVPALLLLAFMRYRPLTSGRLHLFRDGAMALVIIAGVISSLLSHVPLLIWGVSLGLLMKGFLIFYIVSWLPFTEQDVRRCIRVGAGVVAVVFGLGFIEMLDPAAFVEAFNVREMNPGDRFAVRSLLNHPGLYGWFMMFAALFAYAAFLVQRRWRYLIAGVALSFGAFTSGRRKPLVGLPIALVVGFIAHWRRGDVSRRRMLWLWAPIAAASLVLAIAFAPSVIKLAQQTFERDLQGSSARFALYEGSFGINRDYFPWGAGLGRYGSWLARVEYSPLYVDYGLSEIHGLQQSNPSAATDTFWPMILGELGIFGLLGTVAFYALLLLMLWRESLRAGTPLLASFCLGALFIFIEALAESVATASLTGPRQYPLVMGTVGVVAALSYQRAADARRPPAREADSGWRRRIAEARSRIAVGLAIALLAIASIGAAGGFSPRMTVARFESAYPAIAGVLDHQSRELHADARATRAPEQMLNRLTSRLHAAARAGPLWDSAPEYASEEARREWDSGRLIRPLDARYEAWPVPPEPSWQEDPFADRSWRQWYHSLVWIRAPALAHATTSDDRYADEVEATINGWIASNPPDGPTAQDAWIADVVAERLETLVLLHDYGLVSRLVGNDAAAFLESLHVHGTAVQASLGLADPSPSAVMRAMSLYQLAVELPEFERSAAWRAAARTEVGRLLVETGELASRGVRPSAALIVLLDHATDHFARFGDVLASPDEVAALAELGIIPTVVKLDNPDFESLLTSAFDTDGAAIHGWDGCPATTRVTSDLPLEGSFALRMRGGGQLQPCISNTAQVRRGSVYRLVAWVRGHSRNDPATSAVVGVRWIDANGHVIASSGEQMAVGTNHQWTVFSQAFVAPGDAALVAIALSPSAATPVGSHIFFDNLRMSTTIAGLDPGAGGE